LVREASSISNLSTTVIEFGSFSATRYVESVATKCSSSGETITVNCAIGMRKILSSRKSSRMRMPPIAKDGRELIREKKIGPCAAILA
jgi:hypothetical protein